MNNHVMFPNDFILGAATASYQIEGAWNEDGKGESIWDTFTHTQGKLRSGHTGDTACNHYHLYKDDIKLMKKMGLNAYRFSISWPRILPEGKGKINEKGLDFYNRLIDELLKNKIEPFITLFHWDLPTVLQKKIGGFSNRDCAEYFADYAFLAAKRFGNRVKKWITINEPWAFSILGHLIGHHAPGFSNIFRSLKCVHNLLLANAFAYKAIKQLNPNSEIGISLNLEPINPEKNTKKDRKAANIFDSFLNRLFLDPLLKGEYPKNIWTRFMLVRPKIKNNDMDIIKDSLDFIGINNYTRENAYYKFTIPYLNCWLRGSENSAYEHEKNGIQYTSMGWEVYPDSIYEVLIRIKNEYNNIKTYITENGAAFDDVIINNKINDLKRINYLKQYTEKVFQALNEGVNVHGYFAWSLLDNFEWAEGYSKRFGLIHVDHKTQKRIIKESGHWYSKLCKNKINN